MSGCDVGGWDAIGALGNMATYAGNGGVARFGWKLQDDFGGSPLRPAGENTAPTQRGTAEGWSAHLFVTIDGAGCYTASHWTKTPCALATVSKSGHSSTTSAVAWH